MPNSPLRPGTPASESGSFEEQLAELEKLVDQLERGDLTLEQSVSLFERGVRLSDGCKEQLAAAESRIQVLLDPERKGAVRAEELALAVDEGEAESEESEEEE
ncbi:MAG TPA: exodeoxyribonuclease VII small subunit [Candidatus Aquilonibacter sp.]|nr:exodeoxyribonuclease VII small subunit [Candidatus Aquilonibacter sp.]